MSTHIAHAPLRGMLVSPLLWALLFFASYVVSGVGCALAGEGAGVHPADVRFILYCIVAVAGTGILAFGIAQVRCLVHLSKQKASTEAIQPAMLLCGMATLLSAVVLVGAFWLGLNVTLTPACVAP